MGRKRIPRLPVAPLLDIAGTTNLSRAARLLGEPDPRNFYRYARTGEIPVSYADTLAVRLGRHPADIWGDQYHAIDYRRVDVASIRHYETERMTESQLRSVVLQIAELNGWLWHYNPDSRKVRPGFPDLILVRSPRTLFVELKAERGTLKDQQKVWRNNLLAADQEWYLWRPSDLEDVVVALSPDMATRDQWIAYLNTPQDAA